MEQWSYTQNPFLNSTDNSFRKAVKISQLHFSALNAHKSDPDILAMRNFFEPFNLAMNQKFDEHAAHEGSQEGDTLNVRQHLRLLSNPKIKNWDVAIQTVYADDTPQYKALLPNGRRPFQQGPQLMRINAMNILSQAIGSIVLLQGVKSEVNTYYTETNDAYNVQQGSISATKGLSDAVEVARMAMCIAMYTNLGKLMVKYAATPTDIDTYFPLELIRNAQQVDFTNSVKPQKVRFIVKRTLSPSDNITLINDGNTDLQFYLGASKTAQPGSVFVSVPQHSEQQVAATALGSLADHFILVYNPETEQAGHFTLELM